MVEDKCIVVVLGTSQDAGVPQIGCHCSNCSRAVKNSNQKRLVASLGIINQETGNSFIIDCTPDFRDQFFILDSLRKKYLPNNLYHEISGGTSGLGIKGILLTHGHIGHYLGLVQLGREGLDAKGLHIFGTKRMLRFLNSNKPYKDLIKNKNIIPILLEHGKMLTLDRNLSVIPFLVNHRSEYTDTVGYFLSGPTKRVLYAPDFDSITQPILERLPKADISLIDGTFYQDDELSPRRDMKIVYHSPILESMKILNPYAKKSRIFFTHFNHTNPVVDTECAEANYVKGHGFGLAPEKWTFSI